MKTSIVSIISILCCVLQIKAQVYKDLSQKDVFTKGYPQLISFRGEYINSVHVDEATWIDAATPTAGIFKKFVDVDELENVRLFTQDWATNYLNSNPKELVLNHYLGRAHLNHKPGSSDLFFPGHWLSVPGSTLTTAIGPADTVIGVQDISKFSGTISTGVTRYPTLMIVQLDGFGNKLWGTAEYVTIEDISDVNTSNSTITVTRGSALSTAKSHPNGATIVPMTARLGKKTGFDYNLSLDCPTDANGKTAADIILEELTTFHQNGGDLEFAQGISFDLLPWSPRDPKADVNNDGISDNGYNGLENRYAQGAYALMQDIRTMLTDSRLMIGDGYVDDDQRAIGIFDGIESEGLVAVKDAYRGFSKTINVFSYWNEANTSRPYNFSFIVSKFNNPLDAADPNEVDNGTELGITGKVNLERLIKGTATCLNAAYTRPHIEVAVDEDLGGDLNTEQWLGNPTGDLIRLARQTPDLLNGTGLNLSNWSASNATISSSNGNLVVSGNSSNSREDIQITYNNLNVGNLNDDIVIYVEVQALESLVDFPDIIPRVLRANTTGLPTLEIKNSDNNLHNDLWGYMDTSETRLLSFYYRKAGGLNLDFILNAENNGDFVVKSITVHASAQLLARQYENGAVLVNPSLSSKTFSLTDLFPGVTYKKLNGITDSGHNSGEALGNTVDVPAKDALFIYKTGTLGTDNFNKEDIIRLVPNPAKEKVLIQSEHNILDYKVYSMLGKLIKRESINSNAKTINISNLQSGIYIFRFSTYNGSVLKRVVKV
ncbi:T9SS type A sorting domain-containing protein [Tamlana sp. 2201CG12-4]|uniref:T9SS type A sorting domain-containing protein n=1 Tax=Tamlana sp. 2201CG12-4 TaxID=3112582 RepID=UPI002DBE7684|nr:T9SS type A sorting domain-containing protein [Tamlana sp. 2201CG12-4]MEC3908658.1 T9SS type A sorting domain-containing protein [Tamlana sp. 2201CG12-4]